MPTRPRHPRAKEPAETDGAALFRIAERALVGLYERGVLSPAVAEQCIAAFSETAIDWDTAPMRDASDGKKVFDVLAAVLMPGKAMRTPAKAVRALIAQIEQAVGSQENDEQQAQRGSARSASKSAGTRTGKGTATGASNNGSGKRAAPGRGSTHAQDDSDDELVAQFTAAAGQTRSAAAGKGKGKGKARAAQSGTAQPRGFAPLVNARLPRTSKR